MLSVTKKVPLSGEVRLGSYGIERLSSAISYRKILLTATFFSAPVSLVKVGVRCVKLRMRLICLSVIGSVTTLALGKQHQ